MSLPGSSRSGLSHFLTAEPLLDEQAAAPHLLYRRRLEIFQILAVIAYTPPIMNTRKEDDHAN
jgi:hypothetical protein